MRSATSSSSAIRAHRRSSPRWPAAIAICCETGSKRLVPLADELALLDQFLSLVTIRYADGLKVVVQVDAAAAGALADSAGGVAGTARKCSQAQRVFDR